MNSKSDNFWDRPEGNTGMAVAVLTVMGLGWAVFKSLGFIIALLSNAIYATVLAAILGGLVYAISDRRNRIAVNYAYRNAMRWLTNTLIVTIDPIGVMKNYVEDLKDRIVEMNDRRVSLRREIVSIKQLIAKNEERQSNEMGMAQRARDAKDRDQFELRARSVGMLKGSNLKLTAAQTRMEAIYRFLDRYSSKVGTMIQTLELEIETKSQERDALLASWSAVKAANQVMQGDPEGRELFDQGLQFLADDWGQKMGEIEEFMERSSSFIDGLDLENGRYDEAALRQLEEWERQDSQLLGNDKVRLLEHQDTRLTLDAPIESSSGTPSKGYAEILRKN